MILHRRLHIYLFAIHALFFALTLSLYHSTPLLMASLELALLVSFSIGLFLLRKFMEPLVYARRFQELLQDKNYAARLQTSTDLEMRSLIEQFNQMLDALYQERLKLGEQQGFLDRLLEATPAAVVVFDFDDRISLLNASAQTLLGLRAPEGKTLAAWTEGNAEFQPDWDAANRVRSQKLLAQLIQLPLFDAKLLVDSDGRRYRAQRSQFFDRGFARPFLLIEELTKELDHSELATYEKLVRVLAHEVNNTVAATGSVLDSLLFYRDQLRSDDALDFQTAIHAVQRRNSSLGEFIERFTRVVKMPEPELNGNDLVELVDEICALYREPCRQQNVQLQWQAPATPIELNFDRHLLAQALINIVKNAMEAAATTRTETPQFNAFVRIELLAQSINQAAHEPNLAGENYCLSISDSGNRLFEVPAGQLFTPFFSTKKGGQGIGLLFVREVLNRHGLSHRLAATDAGTTRFDIWFAEN